MRVVAWRAGATPEEVSNARWIYMVSTVDQPLEKIARELAEAAPGVPVFGATSFQGVFTPDGFQRGAFLLVGEEADGVELAVASSGAQGDAARAAATEAARAIREQLGHTPNVILMHATPGNEETILAGLDDAFGGLVPVYGGSAADDDLSGTWGLLHGSQLLREGFVVAGFHTLRPVRGDFLGGYLPAGPKGRITRCEGRRIHEIDGQPAAEVYNRWTRGSLREALKPGGGGVLAETSLHPLARQVDSVLGVPLYLLSHPEAVAEDGRALDFFTRFTEGDEVLLMQGTEGSLVRRAGRLVHSALGAAEPEVLAGSILVYCGGCVGAILDRADEVAAQYKDAVAGSPFLGIATFGEQGCFAGTEVCNRHGNLMSDVLLFEKP